MKWFKHISDSLDDPFIFELVSRFGGDGYLVFFGCLEVLAREFKPERPGTCTVSERFLTKKLQVSRQKLVKILSFFEKNSRVFSTFADGKITLNCPKFEDMCDEWSKRQLGSCSGVTPKKLQHDLDLDLDKDLRLKESPPSPLVAQVLPGMPEKERPAARPAGSLGDHQAALFREFWDKYPRKRSKGRAEKAWSRIKPNAELFAAMMQGLTRATRCRGWRRDGGEYIPYPATWLNAKGWEDDYDNPSPTGANPYAEFSDVG